MSASATAPLCVLCSQRPQSERECVLHFGELSVGVAGFCTPCRKELRRTWPQSQEKAVFRELVRKYLGPAIADFIRRIAREKIPAALLRSIPRIIQPS